MWLSMGFYYRSHIDDATFAHLGILALKFEIQFGSHLVLEICSCDEGAKKSYPINLKSAVPYLRVGLVVNSFFYLFLLGHNLCMRFEIDLFKLQF